MRQRAKICIYLRESLADVRSLYSSPVVMSEAPSGGSRWMATTVLVVLDSVAIAAHLIALTVVAEFASHL